MHISEPSVIKRANVYNFQWLEGQEEWLSLELSRVRTVQDTVTARLTAYVLLAEHNVIEGIKINLESLRDRQDVAARLYKLNNKIDFNIYHTCIEQACVKTLQLESTVEPSIALRDIPDMATPRYRAQPLLFEGEANMIYGDGGVGKTTTACSLAVSVQDNVALPHIIPLAGNVLYIDYEQRGFDIKEQCQLIRAGLNTEGSEQDIRYMYLYQKFIDCVDLVRTEVEQHNINLVIIDSVGLACGGEGDDVKAVVPYFQALRSLGVTTLSLDHISKTSDGKTPTGSIYKRNIPRNVFLLKSEQTPGEDMLNLAFINTKANRGLIKPMGLQLRFAHSTNGHVDSIELDSLSLADSEILSTTLTNADRIAHELHREALTAKELAECLPDISESVIKATLSREKERFINLADHRWGVKLRTKTGS